MALHLAETSHAVVPGAHAVVLMEQAGWHMTGKLGMPANISIIDHGCEAWSKLINQPWHIMTIGRRKSVRGS